jgi:hypothetical protein
MISKSSVSYLGCHLAEKLASVAEFAQSLHDQQL